MYDTTIVALSTAPMESALAVIRLSGAMAIAIVNKIFSHDLSKEKSHTIHYGFLKYKDEIIDEVMVYLYRAPNTYTREDMVEISIHGSMIIANKLIATLISLGAKQADKGEFTKRAYLNGRIDLIQAEAVNDIIHGENQEAINIALNTVKGNTSIAIKQLKQKFEDLISNMEVNIDYPEYYDIEVLTKENILPTIKDLLNEVTIIIQDNKIGMMIKNGIKTAIIGKPNVGKSSLLNSLIGQQKAIVTPIPGTTRDIVEGKVNLDGIHLDLLDTAGIHESNDFIENIGINKAKEMLEQADLILLVLDAANDLEDIDYELIELTKNKKRIMILNKSDLPSKINLPGVKISAINNDITALKNEIKKTIGFDYQEYKNKPLLTNARHLGLMLKVKESLNDIESLIIENAPFDLLSVDFKAAYNALKELLGEVSSIHYDEMIFSKFCVGK